MTIRPCRLFATAAIALAIFTIAACGGSSAAATVAPTRPAPTATARATDTATPTAVPPTPTPSIAALTGLGLTSDAWNRLHKEDKSKTPGAAYDRQSNGDDRFAVVSQGNGVVTGFDLIYPPSTSITDLTKAALAQLPADAKLIGKATPGTCELLLYQSAALGKVWAAPKIGDGDGYVGIVLFGETAWDGMHADTAGLSLADASFTKGSC